MGCISDSLRALYRRVSKASKRSRVHRTSIEAELTLGGVVGSTVTYSTSARGRLRPGSDPGFGIQNLGNTKGAKSIVVCFILVIACWPCRADEKGFSKDAVGTIELNGSGSYVAEVQAGEVPFASKGTISISLVNSTTRDFTFTGAVANCSCLKTSLSTGHVAAGETLEVAVTLETPKEPKALEQNVALKLIGESGPAETVQIVIGYDLLDVAVFAEKLMVLDVPAGRDDIRFRMPLVVSNNLKIESLQLQASPGLPTPVLKLVSIADRLFAEVSLPRKSITQARVTGEVILKNLQSGKADTAMCMIRTRSAIEVTPETLRFVAVEGSTFRATCIVKLDPTAFDKYKDQVQAKSIGCKSDKGKLALDCQEISPHLYRANLQLDLGQLEKDQLPNEFYWSVSAGSESAFTKSKAVFPGVSVPTSLKNEELK